MKSKTIRLPDSYTLINGEVHRFVYPASIGNEIPEPEWAPDSNYQIGQKAMLIESSDKDGSTWHLDFRCLDGAPGNSNPSIKRFHGWRGSWNDVATYAHGVRRISKIRELKNGTVAVTVGADLTK